MSSRRPVLAALTGAVLALPLALSAGGTAVGVTAPGSTGPAPGSAVPAAPEPAPDPAGPQGSGVPLVDGRGLVRPGAGQDGAGGASAKIGSPLLEASGEVTAFVQLDAPSGLETTDAGGQPAEVAAAAEQVEQLADRVVADQARARSAVPAPEALSVTTNLVSGVVVSGDAGRIRAFAGDDAVVTVHLIVPKVPLNKGTDAFTRALDAWQATGQTGDGVTIGVIDTGVDYTHATFGGPGTPEAWAEAYGADGTGPVPEGSVDPTKLLGGYDFAGPLYDADPDSTTPGASTTPTPDENPIDAHHTGASSGHGTHVAGTAAGYGVQPDGTTFDGDYAALMDLTDWQVGPGTAPEAGIYALKVFGDAGGSTALTINALEWAADPDGDFDFNDHLDVLNLSLGSDTSPADDPENLFIDALTDLGVLSVIASGNAGDLTDVGGSPGNARSALTVANSVGNTVTYDAVEVTEAADPALIGTHPGQNSVSYTGTDDVTAPVTFLGEAVSGCTPLTPEQAAAVEGTIAWLFWDDDDSTRECGSAVRWDNAAAAGAVGVLIGTELPVFSAGIAGNAETPGAQLTAAATDALLPEVRAGTLVVHLGPSLANAAFVTDPSLADYLNPGSSRGVHGSLGIVKPDVAAPGTLIASAAAGTGDGVSSLSGTSMATPHVAGIAALVAQANPGWAARQVKAAVMNTATHDVHSQVGQSGPVFGPERVGSGRVDALDATTAEVLAFATDDADLVSVTFGVVPVGAETVVERRTVTVRNTGTTDRTFATSFTGATTSGGATITTSPASVSVPAGGTAVVTVTLTADPATLAKELDPTSAASYDLGIDVPRDFVTTLSGRLVLTEPDGPELRVPVQAAPRLVSDLTAEPVTFADEAATSAPLTLTGRGVASGGWLSLVAPFELVASSPQLEDDPATESSDSSIAAADLRYVGFASTAPQLAAAGQDPAGGTLGIGIATQGDWASLGTNVVPIIDTDIDGDGIWDLETYVSKYSPAHDFTTVETYALEYSEDSGYALGALLDLAPVNGLWADIDTTVFDNNVVVAPITLDAVGIEPGATPTFTVATFSPYAADPSGIVDEVEPFTADPFEPDLWFDGGPDSAGSLWYVAAAGTPVTVHRSPTADDTQLLVLHTHNPEGRRAQVVDVTAPVATPTSIVLEVDGPLIDGSEQTLVATVEPAEATGTVRFLDGGVELGTAPVEAGVATLGIALVPGPHVLQAAYVPDVAGWAGSSSAVVEVTVAARQPSSLSVVMSPVASERSAPALATVVRTDGPTPSGQVQVSEDGRVLASARVLAFDRYGAAVVRLPRHLPVGAHHLTITYTGNDQVAPSSVDRVLRVLAHPRR